MNREVAKFGFLICWFFLVVSGQVIAQTKVLTQVKIFNKQLHAVPDLEININQKYLVKVNNKGVAFTEFEPSDLPPKSIVLNSPLYEAESWNYSKGVLQIIVREKKFELVTIRVKDVQQEAIKKQVISFNGEETFHGVTDAKGFVRIPLKPGAKISSKDQFDIPGYSIKNLQSDTAITVELLPQEEKDSIINDKKQSKQKTAQTVEIRGLDSIKSLTSFYSLLKKFRVNKLSDEFEMDLDAKFSELLSQDERSKVTKNGNFISFISDSSRVKEDVVNLLNQATMESATLEQLREDFTKKIHIISTKLSNGSEKLSSAERDSLISDINKLEKVLNENERKFLQNQSDYRAILVSIKVQLLDIQDLEERLIISEEQRLKEKESFQTRMLLVFGVTLGLGLLTVSLIYFSGRLRRQRKELILANTIIKSINENLEDLVLKRTALLQNSNNELDTILYRASHDLRGPIRSIMGLVDIAKHTLHGEGLELFSKAIETANEMDRLLKRLQLISEINRSTKYGEVDMDSLFGRIKQKYATTISEHHVNFKITGTEKIVFTSLPNLVEVIMCNLVDNALFFSSVKEGNSPVVELNVSQEKGFIKISLYDNGIGISTSVQSRIWDMFFVGTEKSKSNGLGLYIVRKSLEALNGKYSVESQENVYSLFTVEIPYS